MQRVDIVRQAEEQIRALVSRPPAGIAAAEVAEVAGS
jgi:hypothetical protein